MKSSFATLVLALTALCAFAQSSTYRMPHESEPHEGTWIAWPHDYTYGVGNRALSERIWIEMTVALAAGENVHIIAYDAAEETHIRQTLEAHVSDMSKVDFYLIETDDYWMRDNGPIYVYDENNQIHLTDWEFNGWGERAPFAKDRLVPEAISNITGMSRIDLSGMVLEGGSIEVDGTGAALLCRSSVTNANRNPNLTEAQIEDYLSDNLGINHFVWLDGTPNIDITDFHIDGFARFLDEHTIITLNSADLLDYGTSQADVQTLLNAQKADGEAYQYLFLPQTQNNVENHWGQQLNYKGSYVNFYVGNSCVLVPTYKDPNDQVAIDLIQSWYPNRSVIGIDVTRIYQFGGMIHCITQQQPVDLSSTSVQEAATAASNSPIFPNPATDFIVLPDNKPVSITSIAGQLVLTGRGPKLDVSGLPPGLYLLRAAEGVQKLVIE